MNSLLTSLSTEQLRRAVEIREKIDKLEIELSNVLGGLGRSEHGNRGKRRMSAAGRAAIAAGARARWAKIKGTSKSRGLGKPKRRKLSPAAKARLSAIAKARWKRAKAAGKSVL